MDYWVLEQTYPPPCPYFLVRQTNVATRMYSTVLRNKVGHEIGEVYNIVRFVVAC